MKKALIVDDEIRIREVIKEYAKFEGLNIEEASDGMEAIELCNKTRYDIIVMDIMMPRLDGFSAVKEIRKKSNTPVIMLSARGEEYDKLFAFELGVDDFVTKPFSPKELMARINAVLNRASVASLNDVAQFRGVKIDKDGRTVKIDDKRVDMTPKEFDLLQYLVENKHKAITRETLLKDIWGYDFFGDDRTIDTHIKMLRNSLGAYRDYIITVRGVGYKFDERQDMDA